MVVVVLVRMLLLLLSSSSVRRPRQVRTGVPLRSPSRGRLCAHRPAALQQIHPVLHVLEVVQAALQVDGVVLPAGAFTAHLLLRLLLLLLLLLKR